MGVHPLKAYTETVAAMGQHVVPERFDDVRWDGQVGFFVGMVTNTKVSRLNEKTDKSYAHLALEDEGGHQLRVKVEPRVYERHRYIIADRGVGTCVALAAIKWKDETAKLCYMVDLEDLRQARRKREPWQGQGAWFAESPVLRHGAPAADINAVLAKKMPRPGGMVQLTAMVVALKEHKDRRKQDMAFFDLAGYQGSVGALCFASSYGVYQGVLEPGTVVKIELIRGDKRSWVLDAEKGCRIAVLEKPPTNSVG
jgi:DNA polymerase III alpha subunit